MAIEAAKTLPRAFVWKRLHSSTGLWLVGFLIIHLFTNSQAALWVGEDGSAFIRSVESIHHLPFLEVIEIFFLAIPFAIHMYWGVIFIRTAAYNSYETDGSKPALPQYPRNRAYTWQRITSWILLVLIVFHVVQMRFLEEPIMVKKGHDHFYTVPVKADPGMVFLADQLDFSLYHATEMDPAWQEAIAQRPLQAGQSLAVAKNFGTAELLMVRETFKIPAMLVLYTVLVLSACFHGFNGLWTFCITWGITLSVAAQNRMKRFCLFLMALITFLGLAAIWGTYWINLRQ